MDPTGCDTLNITGSYDENNNWIRSIYSLDNDGNIMFVPKESYSFYSSIQTCLGGTEVSYTVKNSKGKLKTRYGFTFENSINKKMQYKQCR